MVIEKVHGLQSTSISLNERFTMLTTVTPAPVEPRQKRRQTIGSFLNQSLNLKNRYLIEQIARQLEQQTKRRTLRQRLGVPPGALRRFGSESSLPGLRRFNSFGNLSQSQSVKNRITPRQFNGNMRRSASFTNLSSGSFRGRNIRGFRRRGGNRNLRGRGRGRGQGRVARRVPFRRGVQGAQGAPVTTQGTTRGTARGGARGRARGRGGRGGITRNQANKPVPTKEELDAQLDQYMASTKNALDKELEAYMKNAGEFE